MHIKCFINVEKYFMFHKTIIVISVLGIYHFHKTYHKHLGLEMLAIGLLMRYIMASKFK